MKRYFNYLGVAIVVACFGVSAWRAIRVQAPPSDGRVVIRIAHQLLQTGMRESFAQAAEEYSRIHPNVTVEQIAIPIRMWPQWLRTQLTGGTAPDITSLAATNEEVTSRHYRMLSNEVHSPNPYNAGTPLEGVPWRDTFVDGLSRMYAQSATSGELVGVNLQLNTIRVFYNVNLLRRVTGSGQLPSTYEELRALGDQVERHNREHGTRLVPVASCEPYLPYLAGMLLPSQTQRLARRLSTMRNLALAPADQARLMATRELSYSATPEFQSSLHLLRDVSTLLSPGFASLARDDALFAFMQQHAVAICAGSWDYAAFVAHDAFEVGVGRVPLPSVNHPKYGHNIIGPASEADGIPEAMFGITRYSRQPEVALDFLRFLASYRTATVFTENTHRISALLHVPPPEAAPGLAPQLDGELNGFSVSLPGQFANANIVFNRNLHLLLGHRGDVDAFARSMDELMPAAIAEDLTRQRAQLMRTIRRADAHLGILETAPPGIRTEQTSARFLEIQTQRQFDHLLQSRPLTPNPASNR
jgi:ABC-type glycerol-3-phosphate transport system substrate-binding protein